MNKQKVVTIDATKAKNMPVIYGVVLWIVVGNVLAWCLGGCMVSPQKRGTLTTADIGAKYLTEKGDPFLETGIYAQKNVSPEFAAGLEKGLSDGVKRAYWSMQDRERWIHFYASRSVFHAVFLGKHK
jgi:hypothetical protein